MTTGLILALVAIGLATGALTGLTGASGMSVLISSLLLAGVDIRSVIALTYVVTLVNSISSAIPYWRKGFVDKRMNLTVGLASVPAVFFGYWIGEFIPDGYLSGVIIVFLMLIGIKLLWKPESGPAQSIGVDENDRASNSKKQLWLELLFGAVVGTVIGILGGGGGVIITLGLVLLFAMAARKAIGTSIVIMAIAAVPGFAIHAWKGTIPWDIVAVVAPISIVASFLFARIGRKIPERIVKRMLGIYLVLIVSVMIYQQVAKRSEPETNAATLSIQISVSAQMGA